jgi:hypothetical protein
MVHYGGKNFNGALSDVKHKSVADFSNFNAALPVRLHDYLKG